MSLIYIVILFFVCLVIYKPSFKRFLLWLVLCTGVFYFFSASAGVWGALIYIFVWASIEGGDESSSTKHSSRKDSSSENIFGYDKIYEDGSHRIEKLSQTGYHYSNGEDSWLGMFGDEHRSNGEVVRDNAYIQGRRDIYDASGEYIGYEYEDCVGITHRVEK